jgi:hypothetical protein
MDHEKSRECVPLKLESMGVAPWVLQGWIKDK